MILSGDVVHRLDIVRGLLSPAGQVKHNSITLTLKSLFVYKDTGRVMNSYSNGPRVGEVPFRYYPPEVPNDPAAGYFVHLKPGAYPVDFNETAKVPATMVGQIFPCDALTDAGAMLSCSIVPGGGKFAEDHLTLTAMLTISNPHGVIVYKDREMGEIIFHELSEVIKGEEADTTPAPSTISLPRPRAPSPPGWGYDRGYRGGYR